jgi:hypothetical protein
MTKHILLFLFLIGGFAIVDAKPSQAQSASQGDCGIWLCLYNNFPTSACDPYRKRMYRRLIGGQDPLVQLLRCEKTQAEITEMTEEQLLAAQAEEDSLRATYPSVSHSKKRVTREQAEEMNAPRGKLRYLDVRVGGRKHPRYWY